MVWENIENGIYKHLKSGTYYERPKIDEVHTFRSLKMDRITEARATLKARNDIGTKGEDPQPKAGKYGKGDDEQKFDSEGNDITRTIEDGCVDKSGLIQALNRYRKEIGRIIILHGLRAFYVTVRRIHGIPDNQIPFEIGHTSGGKTLSEVYGGAPRHWKTDGPKMEWLPKGEPAWSVLYSRGIIEKP
jgi:hypothetical protein